MPVQKRVGTDEQRAPTLAQKETAGGGKEGSIRRAQLGSMCLATKNLELVAEHDDLELLELLRTAAEQDQREHASESEIDECEQAQPPRTGSGARLYEAISSAGYIDSPRVPAALYKDRSGLRTPHGKECANPDRGRAGACSVPSSSRRAANSLLRTG
jgi:hypothetical protein